MLANHLEGQTPFRLLLCRTWRCFSPKSGGKLAEKDDHESNFEPPGLLDLRQIVGAPDGDHGDGNRLILRVRGTHASWIYRFTSPANGKRREIGLGSARRDDQARAKAAAIEARTKAIKFGAKLLEGIDPAIEIAETKAQQREKLQAERATRVAQSRTLGRAIREYHRLEVEGSPKFTEKYKRQWLAPFENHLRPYGASTPDGEGPLWRKPIAEVTAIDVMDFLKALQKKLPHTARKTRQRLDSMFEHGKLHGWNDNRPTQAIVRALRKSAPPMRNTPHRALPYAKAPELMRKLEAADSTAARCLRFAVLTAARTNEAIGAEWSELDLATGVWIVPAKKMKQREEHRVDLSPQALELVRQQHGLHARWVFPSPTGKDKPLSNMAMLTALRRLGMDKDTTPHGLARGTFSTWANETGAARPDVIEAALAHREADLIRAAYNRSQFLAERRALLAAWADYLDGKVPASNVIELRQQIAA